MRLTAVAMSYAGSEVGDIPTTDGWCDHPFSRKRQHSPHRCRSTRPVTCHRRPPRRQARGSPGDSQILGRRKSFSIALTLLDRVMLGHDLHPHTRKRDQTRNGAEQLTCTAHQSPFDGLRCPPHQKAPRKPPKEQHGGRQQPGLPRSITRSSWSRRRPGQNACIAHVMSHPRHAARRDRNPGEQRQRYRIARTSPERRRPPLRWSRSGATRPAIPLRYGRSPTRPPCGGSGHGG